MSTIMDGFVNLVRFHDFADPTKTLDLDLTGLATGTEIAWTAAPMNGILMTASTEGNVGDVLISGGGSGSANLWRDANTAGLGALAVAGTWTAAQVFKDTQIIGGRAAGSPGAGRIAFYNLTGQTADVASSKITNATAAGMYRVEYVLADTTSDITAGTVTLTISWTDDVGATTATANQLLTGTGRMPGDVVLYLASGDITFATTHTGIFGSAAYALRIRCAYLG
jgi:WD40 repeat protein